MSWEDRRDQYSDAIDLAHPVLGGSQELYQQAAEMVGNRHSKYALVDLVNWQLTERKHLHLLLARAQVALIAWQRELEGADLGPRSENSSEWRIPWKESTANAAAITASVLEAIRKESL